MSNFLGFESFLVPLGASIADAHNTIKAALTSYGWQVVTDNSASSPTVLEVIPPASEIIGGLGAFEILRIEFTGTGITFYPLKKWVNGLAQQVYMRQNTAGAVTVSCTLNGSTVSYTGVGGNTAVQNLLGLYAAIRASVDANFTAWDWDVSFPSPQNGNDSNTYIYGMNKTVQANKTFTTNANIVGGIFSNYVAPGFRTDKSWSVPSSTIAIDLINGFIYYLQVSARGIALATKTNGGFYGPLHACWANNASAMDYLPVDTKFLTPIELVVGEDTDANNLHSAGRVASAWVLPAASFALQASVAYQSTPPGQGKRRHRIQEFIITTAGWASYAFNPALLVLQGSGLFTSNTSTGPGNDFQVHRVKTLGYTVDNLTFPADGSLSWRDTAIIPPLDLDDWFKFRGTATNEALMLVADTVATGVLASDYTVGQTTINLVDASMMQASGFQIIGDEALQYTGKTGNQLTGVTGGRYATTARNHYASDTVGQGLWFVIINGGAIFAGFNKPS